ncbi:PepSY-associated TM helix domain-containing protein [Commensalibacter oyaizuii]|uniref:PepSY-associated TM helix domain-containing protein n=1 Tax=Commensalibacter oyaizuii TaxID=3043873 RepID=A0ABT6PYP8_9PROT|nr:PepSY-associated TM helix domain-containing protein [Commensalibacter sp. TBRC 16381]MDI2089978.1 PepSY-associated TM helix domain-containing protein [Commensalibacter sp. TBRC 16381]
MSRKFLSICTLVHRWGGLIGGWFCFVLMLTGTITVFDQEITQWMQPQLAYYSGSKQVSDLSIHKADEVWQKVNRCHAFSFIELPSERYPFIRISYSENGLLKWIIIDPKNGKFISTQPTAGGYFFDDLHNNLMMGHRVGDIVIVALSICFLVSIISGIIIHLKHLWKEFFKIRPQASSLRFILDIHIGIGVFFIPFISVMVVSGFLFYAPKYFSILNYQVPSYQTISYPVPDMEYKTELFPMVQAAQRLFSGMPGFIFKTPDQIRVVQSDADQLAIVRDYVGLDIKSGKTSLNINQAKGGEYFLDLMFGMHLARSGGDVLRWIYFILGAGGTFLVASGLIFFSNKRRHFNPDHLSSMLKNFYKFIDGIHVGIILGNLLAIIAVFWANSLLFDGVNKPKWEISVFFIILGLSTAQGLICSFYGMVMKAWKQQLILLSILCLLLPVWRWIQYPVVWNSFFNGYYPLFIIMDFVIMSNGVLFMILYAYLKYKKKIS